MADIPLGNGPVARLGKHCRCERKERKGSDVANVITVAELSILRVVRTVIVSSHICPLP